MHESDAVVIGAGHNGLIAAIALADAGWDVTVLEAQDQPGGAVRSAQLTPGYVTDLFSAFYPLTQASPAFTDLDLDAHGLRWSRAPLAFGQPAGPGDTQAAVVHPDPADTAAHLAGFDAHDGRTWLSLTEQWATIRDGIIGTLFGPFPPMRAVTSLLRASGTADAVRLARFLLLPANRMVRELFRSEQARLLILGNALHADIPLDAPGSGLMGYLLTMLGQDAGFPVPVGGAGELSAALVRRCAAAGGEVICSTPVEKSRCAMVAPSASSTPAGGIGRPGEPSSPTSRHRRSTPVSYPRRWCRPASSMTLSTSPGTHRWSRSTTH